MTTEQEPELTQEITVGPINSADLANTLAWDTTRNWGNQLQVLLNPDHALFILREQIAVNVGSPDGEPSIITKNIASWVLPLDVAEEFQRALSGLNFETVRNAKQEG